MWQKMHVNVHHGTTQAHKVVLNQIEKIVEHLHEECLHALILNPVRRINPNSDPIIFQIQVLNQNLEV